MQNYFIPPNIFSDSDSQTEQFVSGTGFPNKIKFYVPYNKVFFFTVN